MRSNGARIVPASIRFEQFIEKTDGCWNWKGTMLQHGYGIFYDRMQHKVLAHRFSYQLYVGPIPDGLHIDHLCRNRRCVRPSHLEAVTPKTNTLRSTAPSALNAQKSECKNGHPFNEINTLIRPGKRRCRVCDRDTEREKRRARA